MSIFENAALVRESAHVYTQVCFANLQLNGTRYFSVPFKLGLSGSAALPLPRVPLFYFILCLFSVYTFFMRNPCPQQYTASPHTKKPPQAEVSSNLKAVNPFFNVQLN